MTRKIAVILAVVLSCSTMACKESGKEETKAASRGTALATARDGSQGPSSSDQILARLNGQAVTDEEVRKISGPRLVQAEAGVYDVRKGAIDQIIDDRLLEVQAKKEEIAKADYLKKNVFDKIKIEDKDIEKFYNENKGQMQGKPLDEVKGNIRGFLFQEKHQKVYGDLLAGLREKANVEILISVPRFEVKEGDSEGIGPKDAPIKVVEFTDYQCPYCGKSRPTVNQMLDEYKGKVRYVLRDFPLSFHKDAVKAHEGARCAGDQKRYWEMNKKLFSNQTAIKMDDLKKYAEELKLDMKKFDECLSSDKYTKAVQEDQAYGETVGVSGTPAFFINGRMISGARPYASFKEIIDDELRESKK